MFFVPMHRDLRAAPENHNEEYKHAGVSCPGSLTSIVKEESENPIVRPDDHAVLDNIAVATTFPGLAVIHPKIERDMTFGKASDKHTIEYVFECMLSHE